jgi:hypothetical protein
MTDCFYKNFIDDDDDDDDDDNDESAAKLHYGQYNA